MKKTLIILISFFMFSYICYAQDFARDAKSAILIEYSTGKVIYEKNANERLAPASMTKIMTLLLTMEAIDEGKVNYDTLVPISLNASSMGGSQMFLEANTQIRLEELIKGLSIASANDGAVAIAELLGGSVDNFVNIMNERAHELGLENTNFVNPHGLDVDSHYSSARDMAIIARELIKHQDILKYTSTYEEYLNKSDGSRTWLVNTNKLVRFYSGVDGLKTGYTKEAGYCLTATAKKNGVRYISVVMGEPSSDIRSKETTELLNYAFNSFKLKTILDTNKELGKINILKGNIDMGTLVVKNDITQLEDINAKDINYKFNIITNNIKAPVKNGDVVGKIEVLDNEGLIVREEDLTIKENINKINYFQIIKKNFKLLLNGK